MAQSRLPEKLADGRSLLIETWDFSTSFDKNGIAESVVRFEEASEAESKKGHLGTISLTAAKANMVNRNRRFYSKEVFQKAVERAQPLIKDGNFLGEVDHPYMGSLREAAVRFTKVNMEGDLVQAKAVILNTAGGQHLKALMDGGVGVKVSTRGYGTILPEKRDIGGVPVEIGIVQPDYTMEGIDFVLFPSNPHGRVHSESTTLEKTGMTLEQLRKEHPELVAQLETAAREGFVAQADVEKKVSDAVAAAKAEGIEEGKKQAATESQPKLDALNAVVEAVKALVPAPAPAKEGEKKDEDSPVAKLEAEVARLTALVTASENEKKAAKEAADKAAAQKAVSEKVEELLKDYAHRELVEADLRKCETVEAVEKLFGERKGLIEQTLARASVLEAQKKGEKGTGKAADDKTPTTEALTTDEQKQLEAVNRDRSIIGLAPLTTLPSKAAK